MRAILRGSIVIAVTIGWLCPAIGLAAENSIVIRPDDFAQIDVKGPVVEVLIKGPKAKRLAAEQRHTTIEFNVPFAHEKDVLISETRFGLNSATMTFRFPTPASAADFASLLKVAKAKILSECDCK
jgi:hypothetical protein